MNRKYNIIIILLVSDAALGSKNNQSSQKKSKESNIYDKVYFDSDSDEESSSKGIVLTNLQLLWLSSFYTLSLPYFSD